MKARKAVRKLKRSVLLEHKNRGLRNDGGDWWAGSVSVVTWS